MKSILPAESRWQGLPRLFYCQQNSVVHLTQREWMRLSRGETDDYTSQRKRLLDWSSSPSGSNKTAQSKKCCCSLLHQLQVQMCWYEWMTMAEEAWVRSDQQKTKQKQRHKPQQLDSRHCSPSTRLTRASCKWLCSVWPVVVAGRDWRKRGKQADISCPHWQWFTVGLPS